MSDHNYEIRTPPWGEGGDDDVTPAEVTALRALIHAIDEDVIDAKREMKADEKAKPIDVDEQEIRMGEGACAIFGYAQEKLIATIVRVNDDHTIIEIREN